MNVIRNGAGGITTKSLWLQEHIGHRNPVILANEYYMLNAVGVPDAGVEKARDEIGRYKTLREEMPAKERAPIIANIIAGRVDDYAAAAKVIAETQPDILEVNISCPNVEDEFGKPFACSAGDAGRVTAAVKKALKEVGSTVPVTIKLSPNVESIVPIVHSIVENGGDAVTVMNSMGPGMAINIEMRAPILTNRVGGLTGPALKPIAVKYIHEIRRAFPNLPIIGTGGVLTGRDAIEMMMAGATLIGIGTGVHYRGVEIFGKVAHEMDEWCTSQSIKNLSEIINAIHAPAA